MNVQHHRTYVLCQHRLSHRYHVLNMKPLTSPRHCCGWLWQQLPYLNPFKIIAICRPGVDTVYMGVENISCVQICSMKCDWFNRSFCPLSTPSQRPAAEQKELANKWNEMGTDEPGLCRRKRMVEVFVCVPVCFKVSRCQNSRQCQPPASQQPFHPTVFCAGAERFMLWWWF